MSLIADELGDGLADLEDALGGPVFIWAGQTYRCAPSEERRGTLVNVGGLEAEISLTLFVRQTVMSGVAGNLPSAGKVVMHAARTYRVLGFTKTPGGATYEIDLGNPHK